MIYRLTYIVLLVISCNGMAQNFNTEVEAKILTRSENDLIRIAGTALNGGGTSGSVTLKQK